jgi:krueppel-like factor 6/7
MDRYLKDEPKPKAFKTEPHEIVPWELFTAPGPIQGSWSVKVDPLCFDELLNDRNLDSISMSSSSSTCSGKSWDSSLSCSVVVKKERIDDEYDDSDSNDEKLINCINNNNIVNSKNLNTKNIQIIKGSNKLTNSTIELLIARTSPSSSISSSSSSSLSNKTSNSISASTLSTMLLPAVGGNHEILPTLTPPSSPESSSKCSNSKNLTISEPELALIDHQGIYRVSNSNATLTRNTIVRLSSNKNTFGVTKILQVSPNLQAQVTAKNAQGQGNTTNQTGACHIDIFEYFHFVISFFDMMI